MQRQQRRTYTDDEVIAAVKLAKKKGVSAASSEMDINTSTIDNWLSGRSRKSAVAKALEQLTAEQQEQVAAPDRNDPTGEQPSSSSTDRHDQTSPSDKSVAKRYTPSQRARILEYAAEHGVSAAARQHSVSRFSIYDWRRKVTAAARGEGESPTSGPDPSDIERQRDREILAEWHRQPGLGPSQIRNQLRRKGVKVSVHTVRRVMQDEGYRPPKVKRHPHDERFEATRPNQMWHLDYLHRHINRAPTFSLILLDDFSRYAVGHGVDDAERADLVIRTFEEAVQRYGRPESVLHDKGSAFWSWRGISRFTRLLTELGIDQIAAEHKQWNGKLEVFNANLAKELFDAHHFYDVAQMKRRLATHLHWYNHQRTNHALGGLLVPADRFYGRVDEVMALIEAGAGGRDLHAIDLRDRALRLFEIVSQGGDTVVRLMGRTLFEMTKTS